MKSNIEVTVVIPVRNEEINIQKCLDSLINFEEIIVIDSSSTDKTVEIAEDFGATVIQFNWNGAYPKKRNWFLLNHNINTKWVLFLDADECMTADFEKELVQKLSIDVDVNGYWINYTNNFLGSELKYGLAQRKLALIKHGAGLYERIEESRWSALDMEIHEHPIVEGKVGEIGSKIIHNDMQGLSKFLTRHIDYASWEAKRLVLLDSTSSSALTGRQKMKYKFLLKWWFPYAYFTYTYLVKYGFLDGRSGFHYAVYKAWYFNSVRLMFIENELKA